MNRRNPFNLKFFFLTFLISLLFACHPTIKKDNRIYEESLEPVNYFYPEFNDDMDWESLISALEKNQFKKIDNGKYSRGKVYGDFSAKAIKLSVEIDEEKKQVKVYASFFGVLFDTGDIWKVTSEIVN